MLIPKIVNVVWEDACSLDTTTWAEAGDTQTWSPAIMNTVGYLLYDGPEGVIMTETVNSSCFGPRGQIPRGMIRSVTVLQKEGTKEIP